MTCEDDRGMGYIYDEVGDCIAHTGDKNFWKGENLANAHLLANAKRLYEALELALTRMAHKQDCMVCLPSDQWAERGSWAADNCQCEIAIVKASLAAARGEKK